jgi:hypothetical protein
MISLLFFSCDNKQHQNENTDKYTKSKLTVAEIEKKNPVRFLEVTGKDKHNLIGQTVVKGAITSKATVAVYKDISVSISFIDKSGVVLEKDEEVINEEIKPGTTINFKSKYFAPKGTNDITMKIIGAASVN